MADYCTVAEVKARLNISSSDYDTLLAVLVTAAARLVDRYVRQADDYFAATTSSAREFDGTGGAQVWIDDCIAIDQVAVKAGASDTTYDTWATTDYVAWPYNSLPWQRLDIDVAQGSYSSFTAGQKTVRVTGTWGYSATVPEAVAEAAMICAARLFKRAQGGYADTEGVAELGVLRYVRRLAPEVALILDLYRVTGKRITGV